MLHELASRAGARHLPDERKVTIRAHWAAALVAMSSAILMTWPLAANAGQQVLRGVYFWDAYTNAMILGSRVDAALGRGPLSLYDNYFFAPLPNSIVFNENFFGLSLLFAPFYSISGNPLWAYNLTLLLSLALSVFFTYLLVLRLTRSPHAGLIAGVAFAFCPYVLFEIGRIQLVATQWIPASFLFLHRALEERRVRDIIGFWSCFVLQVGTCLYNSMFMLPLLVLVGWVLLARQRPSRRFLYWFAGVGACAGLVALAMVYPYFAERSGFNLQRSVDFASNYDGKLGFFANVHQTNRTLTGMQHIPDRAGAHEEIAFPGFSVLLLTLIALAVPAWQALQPLGAKRALRGITHWLGLGLIAVAVTLLGRSMLPGSLVFVGGAVLSARRQVPQPFGGARGLYLAVLLLALALFVGFTPLHWHGLPVRGLYYYLHAYFPGFDGIRKVSRQALMTSFTLCVLAGFGGAWLFAKMRGESARLLASALFLGALTWELRSFPHPVERVWGGSDVPAVLGFAASLPPNDLIASVPQNTGRQRFRGDAGLTLHNYLALYHKHRFVNGQSSWQPPVTELARRALDRLPDDGARRALLAIGARELIVFGEDLSAERQDLPSLLTARPNEYRRLFQQGSDSVFRLLQADDPSLGLLEPAPLPALAELVPKTMLRANASLAPERALFALDGKRNSFWTSGRVQESGQYFELQLAQPRQLLALEIEAPGRVMDVPVSYRLSAANGDTDLGVIAEQSVVRFFRAQVFSPETFVFRVVFARPVDADRVRFTVAQPVPGQFFSIHELRLYAAPVARP